MSRLETGNLPLEESLGAYEEGVGLARAAHQVLDAAERRVEPLVRAGEGGPGVREPLDPRPLDDEPDSGG